MVSSKVESMNDVRVTGVSTEGMTEHLIDRESCHLSSGERVIAGSIPGSGVAAGHCSRSYVLELAIEGSVVAHTRVNATWSNETAQSRSAVNSLRPIAVGRREVHVGVRETWLLLYCRRIDDDSSVVPCAANWISSAVENACAVGSRYDRGSVDVKCHVVVEEFVGPYTHSAASKSDCFTRTNLRRSCCAATLSRSQQCRHRCHQKSAQQCQAANSCHTQRQPGPCSTPWRSCC